MAEEQSTPITDEDMREFIASVHWQFAKTMAHIPHEYTVKNWLNDWMDFHRVVQYIREHGYDERFGRKLFRYYNIDGYKYWTMGAPIEETIIINRAKL